MHDIAIRNLDKKALEWARKLHNDPSVLMMLTDPHVVSAVEQAVWFERISESYSSQRLVASSDGVDIGVVRIDQIDGNNLSVCVGLDIHFDHRAKGFAKPIYRKVFKFWFEEKKFNRIWLMVASYNKVALHLYTSLGFKEEGTQRQALYKDGKFFDYIFMAILKEEYLNGSK